MRRLIFAAIPYVVLACSGGSFDVASTSDTSPAEDTSTSSGDTGALPADAPADVRDDAVDSGLVERDTGSTSLDGEIIDVSTDVGVFADASCPAVHGTTVDLYVDGNGPFGGNGSQACPFRTLSQAALAPLATGIDRVVHVAMATYTPPSPIKLRPREKFFADAGIAKVVVPATAAACAPAGGSCAFIMDTSSVIDGFLIDGGGVTYGIVANAPVEPRPAIRNTIVRQMAKDGIVVFGAGARIGPNAHANDNGQCGMVIRAGNVAVDNGGNGFDDNRGGVVVNGALVPGAGILVYAGSLFVDNFATAKRNHVGVAFDATGISPNQQVLSQIDLTGNRAFGVYIGKDFSKVQIRKANIHGNALAGIYLEYNANATNTLDLGGGTAGPGGNNFGIAATKNGRAALFLCNSGASGSLSAEGNNWPSCPPKTLVAVTCELPTVYADVVFKPANPVNGSPLAPPGACTSM